MRNRALHDALRQFALESAALLTDDQRSGAELPFDLEEGGARRGPSLYQYRPLTQGYIAERWPRLRALESFAAAAYALGDGASSYLRLNGLRGADPEPALQAMLERLYADSTGFEFPEERFERTYREVEATLYQFAARAALITPVWGLELRERRVELLDGVSLVRGEAFEAPDEAVWGAPSAAAEDGAPEPNTLCVFERDVHPEDPFPLAEAQDAFARLLTGLRLFKPGGVALGALGWRRTGDSRWQPLELDPTGVARGEPWILVEGEDAELREFLTAIQRRLLAGTVAWALSRFEMGCSRAAATEALSDYLLALRALLDAEGASLALRMAILCAEESERRRLQRRMELVLTLERFVVCGGPRADYLQEVGSESPHSLVNEVERHLRALLRDILCGYLDPDLRAVADDMLLASAEPVTTEIEALGEEGAIRAARLPRAAHAPREEPGGIDDDPASYSAPI